MGENGIAFEKGCLMSIFQIIVIILAFTVIGVNIGFEESVKLDLKCLKMSETKNLCVSVFQTNNPIIPFNKGFQATSLNQNPFKVLIFQQDAQKLNTIYQNSIDQYFHLVNYDQSLNSIQNLKLDISVPAIQQLVAFEEGNFLNQTVKSINFKSNFKVAVFYFVQSNIGASLVPSPEIKVTFPNRNSIEVNNFSCIVQCLVGIFVLILWIMYRYLIDKSPKNINFWKLNQLSRVNRIIQFLLNFGMNNLVYFLTIHNFWKRVGLEQINMFLGFSTTMVPLFQANAYASFIGLFPEWLLLSYFIYLVLERYVNWNQFKIIIVSALCGAVMLVLDAPWPQFIFQFSIIGVGLVLSTSTKLNSNNKLTVPLVFVSFTLVLMIIVKMRWVSDEGDDFIWRFFYNQLFITNTFLSFLLSQQQINAKNSKTYIPYDEYSMQQEQELENDPVPHAEKIGSQNQ